MEDRPVAVITGASRGLGEALARALAERRWGLVLDARGGEALHAVTASLPHRAAARAVPGSVTDAGHREAWSPPPASLGRSRRW